jgi:hypothetical protein
MTRAILVTMFSLAGCLSAQREDSTNVPENVPDDEMVYCAPVQVELTAGECRLLKRQIDDLRVGLGQLTAPDEMKRGDTATVTFSVAAANDDPSTATPDKPSVRVVDLPVKIGRLMGARLEGSNFKVVPDGEQLYDLGASTKAICGPGRSQR